MGKVLSILIGLILVALGIWGISAWSAEVIVFLKAAIALMAVVIGLGIFVFGLSELRAGGEEALPVEQPGESAPSEGAEEEKGSSSEA